MICLVLVISVLVQHGRGADMGAVFGGGASSTIFGSRGAGTFLTKVTTGAAIAFMLTCVALGYRINQQASRNIFEGVGGSSPSAAEAPADDAEESLGGFEEIPLEAPPARAESPEGEAEPGAGEPDEATPDPGAPVRGPGTAP